MTSTLSKICLGTAQWGMPYGINNTAGQPSLEEIKKIVDLAFSNGIKSFDTSPEYGNSQEILGTVVDNKLKPFFVSKVPPTDWHSGSDAILKNLDLVFKKTLQNLRISSLPIYLFHRFDDLVKDNNIILKRLTAYQKNGLIKKIGVSVYTPEEAEKSLAFPQIKVIQIPFNLIDKRLLKNGLLKKVKDKKIVVLVRSVFLQGLFFKKNLSPFFKGFKPYQKKIESLIQKTALPVDELALRYVLSTDGIDSILLGSETVAQVKRNLAIVKKGVLGKKIIDEINSFGTAPLKIIDPRNWPKNV